MGITKGVVVQIKKIAPLGDPVDIELRGYELCLRRADMRQIDIKVIEDENSFSRQSK
jgi:ferrous iron transport protein A